VSPLKGDNHLNYNLKNRFPPARKRQNSILQTRSTVNFDLENLLFILENTLGAWEKCTPQMSAQDKLFEQSDRLNVHGGP